MGAAETATTEWIDPRIRRTRLMFQGALERLLEQKAFEKISVGDIAGEAALNRATFYDHYTDKFALLEDLMAARFQELLHRRNVIFDGTCTYALKAITLAMCDYLAGLPGMDCPTRQHLEKHFESAMVSVVRGMLLAGMNRESRETALSPELAAGTIGGAIYGGAKEWVRMPNRPAVEEAVDAIFALVGPMLSAHAGAIPEEAHAL